MTMQRIEALHKHWAITPPGAVSLAQLSLMVQKYLGFRFSKPEASGEVTPEFATLPDIED